MRARGWRKDQRVGRRPKQPKTPRAHNEHSAQPPPSHLEGTTTQTRGGDEAWPLARAVRWRHGTFPPPSWSRPGAEEKLDPAPGRRDVLTSHSSPPPLALVVPRGGSCLRRPPKAVCNRSRWWCSFRVSVTAVCSNRWLCPPGRDISGPRGILSDDCTESARSSDWVVPQSNVGAASLERRTRPLIQTSLRSYIQVFPLLISHSLFNSFHLLKISYF